MHLPSEPYPPLTTYLSVHGAPAAIDFYQRAFGATERYRLTDSSSGQIGHAELDLNGSLIMLTEENPAWNIKRITPEEMQRRWDEMV
ncbi:hypothetical protein HQ447_01890, partial [bacterium]|nr:hypothetical protein [bacterium]